MQNLVFFLIIFLFPFISNSQAVDGACTWTGADHANNTNWTNAGNWSCAGYPSGSSAVVTINGGSSTTITLDADITLKQFKHGGSTGGSWTLDQASGGSNTLTLEGDGVTQVWQHNRGNCQWTINANMTIDGPANGTKQFKVGTSSQATTNSITWSSSSTLTLSADTSLKFVFDKDGHSLTFNGTITSGGNDKDLIFADLHTVTFGSTVNMSNMGGDLLFYGSADNNTDYTVGTASTGGITVNGDVSARQIKLSASSLTVNVTGSLTSTNTSSAQKNLASDGSGKFILKTSQSNSGSIIATTDTGGYTLDFVRTLDSDSEITLLGIPVTNETIQDLIDNGNLRTKSGKSFLGYFDNSSGTYSYYDSSGNSGNLGSGTNSDGKSLSGGTGFIISPDGTGSKDITISGTTTSQSSANTFTVYRASGTYGAYQLVGNPFPSYVALNANADGTAANNFLQTNETILDDSYEQIWAWDGSQWNTYNLTENTVKHIAPGEGFFIRLTSTLGTDTAGSVIFNESMQKNGSFRNFNASVSNGSQMNNKAVVRIKVTDLETNKSDKVKLYFSDNSTKGLDKGYDGGKFFIKNSAYMYTRLLEDDQGVDMGIQALPYSDLKDVVIPLGIETESSSIELSFIERDLSDLYNIFLEDRLNNTIVKFDKKLKIDLENQLNGHNRFFLHFTDGLIPELPTDNDLRIFKNSSSNLSIIGNPNQRYKAKIFDYSGRLVKEAEFIHKSNIDELDSRMKILRIESKDGLTVKKFKLN